jgi:integrase
MADFPINLEAALNEMEERYRLMSVTWLKMKICTGIRTGKRSEGRGLCGLSADTKSPSYILFKGSMWRAQAFEKKGEIWPITWIPAEVLTNLRTLCDEAQTREKPFIFPYSELRKVALSKAWKKTSKKHTGAELTFHDLRKVSITWLYTMGIPLEIATTLNVGWKDLSTARAHYLELRAFLKKSARQAYRENIPEWYKDGLEEYTHGRAWE